MRKRLPSFPFVTVKGPLPRGAPVPAVKTAGARRSKRAVPSRRSDKPTTQLWQAVWCGLISCGLGTRVGAWKFRKWLSLSSRRNGWLETARALKSLCGELRGAALEQRRARVTDGHFPAQLTRWLDRRLSVKGKLAFSRVARALPCAPESVVRAAVDQHVEKLSSRHVTCKSDLASIKEHVHTLLKGSFQESIRFSVPSSSAAVAESKRVDGGYNAYISSLSRPAWSQLQKGLRRGGETEIQAEDPSILARAFGHALRRKTGRLKYHAYPTVASAQRNLVKGTELCLREAAGKRVVHQASVIAELGMKARIITIPPASSFARGDLVRQVIWKPVQERVLAVLPYAPHTEDAILSRLATASHPSKVFLSADLTCATDGFGHDAIIAVCDGLRKAGLPDFLYRELRESLGVGVQPHYVEYRLSDMGAERAAICRKRYEVVDGKVQVPKVRGSLMGTPCSFTILSLLNHWMSHGLGPHRIICGDDLAAVTHPHNVSSYAVRASSVGSELHQGKSYRSKIGFVFCEAYGLLGTDGRSIKSFRPASLKEFVREGNGVMNQHSVDSSSFNRLARCARTIYRKQRLIAAKRQRPAELPAALGGLGHPCKGRLRVPRWCREALKELYLCENAGHGGAHDPTRYIRSLNVPAVPSSKDERKLLKDLVGRNRKHVDALVVSDYQPGDSFIANRDQSAYVSTCANLEYIYAGGKYKKVRTQEIRPGKQSWPKPQDGCLGGVLSTHTRIRTVLEWDRRARCELGSYFPANFSAHVRVRTRNHRDGDIPGDVGE